MTPQELKQLQESLRLIEAYAPLEGGRLTVDHSPSGRPVLLVYGDRTGFVRLSLALLRYAVDAEFEDGCQMADGKEIRDLFASPSDVIDLFMQIDDAARKPRRRHPMELLVDRIRKLVGLTSRD
jgi:hypothetical protein